MDVAHLSTTVTVVIVVVNVKFVERVYTQPPHGGQEETKILPHLHVVTHTKK